MEIKLENVSYEKKLLRFSYEFRNKSVTSIIGSSGSGKSLIGCLMMGLVDSYRGNIYVDGVLEYDKDKFLKEVGYVYQNPKDHFFLETVRDEIGFGLKQFQFKLDKMESQIVKSLKMVGLDEEYLNRNIDTLSSGEMERVAIASSLVLNPKVLILDEPTVYLDYSAKRDLVKLIRMLRERYGKSVIIMSNDINFVYQVSDEYVLIHEGKKVKCGKIEDLISDSEKLLECNVEIPLMNQFVDVARERKGIHLEYTNDIVKLTKEVVDHVE